jgi:hypothetical protein
MKKNTLIRVVVYSAILAWPAVESYRLYRTQQQLATSTEVYGKVSQRLAKAKATTQVARAPGQ